MQEIELKILNIDKAAIEQKLVSLGAKKQGHYFIVEKAFDFKNQSISRRKNLLRLRSVGEKVEIVYKNFGVKSGRFKIMEETQTEVSDFKTMEKILLLLGLKCIKHREKYRTTYLFKNVHCEIDQYPEIPPYLEIEGSKKDILETLAALGIPFSKTTNKSATQVLKKYQVNHEFLSFKKSK